MLIAEKHFVQIERAKEVLLDKEMRKKYDEWRRGGFKRVISFQQWLDIQPQVHQVHNNVHSDRRSYSIRVHHIHVVLTKFNVLNYCTCANLALTMQ